MYLDASGYYYCFAIVLSVYKMSPLYYKIEALYVDEKPIHVDLHPFCMGYQLRLFGRLPAMGEVIE